MGVMKIVRYEGAFSPQNYVEAVTGQCYLLQADNIAEMIMEIQHYLNINGYYLQSYPLSALQQVLESKLDVVLVELAGEDSRGEWDTVYRWFEAPKSSPQS